MKPKPRYFNFSSFKIICAGADGKFGKGTVLPDGLTWTKKTAATVYPPGSDGADDLSNFFEYSLGRK